MASLYSRLTPTTSELLYAQIGDYELVSDERVVELDMREDRFEKVQLLWSPENNRIYIRMTDKQHDIPRVYLVPNHKARDAFQHPHCYTS